MNVGDRVRVVEPCDEIGDPRYIGHTGTVTELAIEGEGIGECAERPLVVVTFDHPVWLRRRVAATVGGEVETLPGYLMNEQDGFWPEELQPWL